MPSANAVWGTYLREHGFKRYVVPDDCGEDYTVRNFSNDYNKGTYILAIGGHVVCVIDGTYYDSWDSGDERPVYYWSRQAL